MAAAIEGGAGYVGLMFYPPSPRFLTFDQAARLSTLVPDRIERVGVFVDPPDELIAQTLDTVPLDMVQLHGNETPRRVAEIRGRFALPVLKAIKISKTDDLTEARAQEPVADMLLFDAKAPVEMTNALPGGNALAFDWKIVADHPWACPWMLSGGLDASNLDQAIATSGARRVDVSSGTESTPGQKDPALIRAFLAAAAVI